jgi:hypothetical protein
MKKLVLLPMMIVFLLTGNAEATELISPMPSPTGFWIKVTINFHRPKKDCLSGFGICGDLSWGLEDSFPQSAQELCPVKALLNDKNQLILEIQEVALSSYNNGSTMTYFKDKTSITIPDPYTLSPGTCKALGSKTPLTVKPGDYPVSFANGAYSVVIQL